MTDQEREDRFSWGEGDLVLVSLPEDGDTGDEEDGDAEDQ